MNRRKNTLQFSEMLLSLLKGNTSLADALQILSSGGLPSGIRDTAGQLMLLMKKGRSFSDSLNLIGKSTIYFPPVYTVLIRAAEMTGTVEYVLEDVLEDMRRKQKTRETIYTVMLYPSIIILIACAGTAAIICKGIPLFVKTGLISAAMLNTAFTGIIFAGLFLLVAAGIVFFVLYRIYGMDSPGFRIFYLLSFLLKNNIPLSDALSQCISSLGESKQGKALLLIKKDISAGVRFPEAFAKSSLFSSYVIGWLTVADKNGDIAESFKNIAGYFQKKDSHMRELASKCIEPAVIIITGIYLLILIQSVILPILTRAGGML